MISLIWSVEVLAIASLLVLSSSLLVSVLANRPNLNRFQIHSLIQNPFSPHYSLHRTTMPLDILSVPLSVLQKDPSESMSPHYSLQQRSAPSPNLPNHFPLPQNEYTDPKASDTHHLPQDMLMRYTPSLTIAFPQ